MADRNRDGLRAALNSADLHQHRSENPLGNVLAGTMGRPGVGRMQPHHNDQPLETGSLRSPMEAHSSYRGSSWSPQRLVFHQNLEAFADRVGLLVGLQANGKLSQEAAYAEIRRLWKELKQSKDNLIDGEKPPGQDL